MLSCDDGGDGRSGLIAIGKETGAGCQHPTAMDYSLVIAQWLPAYIHLAL